MKPDINDSVCVTFQLCAQLAIWHSPYAALTTPAGSRKQFFVWGKTAPTDTSIISILRLSNVKRTDAINSLLQIELLDGVCQSVICSNDTELE